ncbi:MAG: nucleotide exchange factor GrpE [Syntrophales bacterium]
MPKEELKKDATTDKTLNYQEKAKKVESQPKEKSENLLIRLEEKEREAAENFDKYMRAVADLENYKKRAGKEKSELVKYCNENLIRDILPLADSLERACKHACNSDDFEAFKTGLKLVQEQLDCCLEKHGVEKIEAMGKDFDPNIHEALFQADAEEHEDNKVIDEIEKGYLLNSRLLRPAKVSVGKSTKHND